MLNTSVKSKFVQAIVLAFVAGVASVFVSSFAQAQTAGPPGCSQEQPYNCAMSRSKFDQFVASWCALAKPDKVEPCKLTFFTFVHASPTAVQENAGFAIPTYCAPGSSVTEQQKQNIPDFCYVIAKRPSGYYNATKKLIEECGLASDQDATCASNVKQQFLHDRNSDWADKPNAPKTGSGNSAIETNNITGRSNFINRISTYIRWLTVGIGVLAVFGLVISGIQYAAAQENPQSVAAAKSRINNIVIGIIIYLVMFAMLQWLIPGGLFSL